MGAIAAINTDTGEVLINRTRGGSKSTDSIILALYFAYLGFKVILYGPTGEHTRVLTHYLYQHKMKASPFLKACMSDDARIYQSKTYLEMKGKGKIWVKNAGGAGKRGPRGDVVIYDEERQLDRESLTASEGTQAGTDMLLKIHMSTPFEDSVFHKNYIRLKRRQRIEGQQLVFERPWYEIPRFYERPRIRKKFEMMKERYRREGRLWEFLVEYECKFEMPKGRVFTNVSYEPYPHNIEVQMSRGHLVAGLDWNPVSGHWLVAGKWMSNHKEFVVSDALSLGVGEAYDLGKPNAQGESLYSRIKPFFTNGDKLCVEKGGINRPFCEMLRKLKDNDDNLAHGMNPQISYEKWDNEGKNKYAAAMRLRVVHLRIDEQRFPTLAEEVRTCAWDEESEKPKLAKNPASSPHALDALLHAVSRKNLDNYGSVDFGTF